MKNSRLVLFILFVCLLGIVTMIVLINMPRKNESTGALPILYPTSVPNNQRGVFPNNPPLPSFRSDTSKYQYLGDILYDLPADVTLPTKMAGYSVDSYSITAQQASSLARTFGIYTDPEIITSADEQILSWKKDEEVLSVSLASGSIEYSNSTIPAKTEKLSRITSKEQLIQKALAFLKSHGLVFADISPSEKDVTYFIENGGEMKKVETFDEASIFSVSLPRKLDGIPVVSHYGNLSQSAILIDTLGGVKKLSFLYAAVQRGSVQAIMDLPTAKAVLPKGGALVHLGHEEESVTQGSLQITTFSKVQVGFFDDRKAKLFYPIFIFTGSAISQSGEVYDATVYLPAFAN